MYEPFRSLYLFNFIFQSFNANNQSSGSFLIQEMHPRMSPSQHRYHHYEPPPPPAPSFLNEQILLSAAALAASHSYPPPSSYLSSIAASNLLSSINAHFHSITPPSTNYFDEKKDFQDQQLLPTDVKNLIESSLTAIGLDNVNDNDFDKAATNAQNNTDVLIDDDMDSFERSTTPATNNTSPTHLLTSTTKQITRPVNIPNSFSNDYFSHSPSAKSPFDAPNQLFDEPLESVCLS
jgi:hypothetical protein